MGLRRRLEIAKKYIKQGYKITLVLKILGINRSTWYYNQNKEKNPQQKKKSKGRPKPGYSMNKKGKKIKDEQITITIKKEIAGDSYCYGYKKITKVLNKQYKIIINKKKVYRILKELKLLKTQRKRKKKHPKRIAKNRTITKSNQLWETDIKYGYIPGIKKFFYILSVIDIFDKEIIDYHIGLRCTGRDAKQTVINALAKRGILNKKDKPIVRTDNGTQFTSNIFKYTMDEVNVCHELIPVRTPNKNAHIESFHNLLQDEKLKYYSFKTFKEAYIAVYEYMDYYNNRRIHGSLDYMIPVEFYNSNNSIFKDNLVLSV